MVSGLPQRAYRIWCVRHQIATKRVPPPPSLAAYTFSVFLHFFHFCFFFLSFLIFFMFVSLFIFIFIFYLFSPFFILWSCFKFVIIIFLKILNIFWNHEYFLGKSWTFIEFMNFFIVNIFLNREHYLNMWTFFKITKKLNQRTFYDFLNIFLHSQTFDNFLNIFKKFKFLKKFWIILKKKKSTMKINRGRPTPHMGRPKRVRGGWAFRIITTHTARNRRSPEKLLQVWFRFRGKQTCERLGDHVGWRKVFGPLMMLWGPNRWRCPYSGFSSKENQGSSD